jgi:hypothetical protein
MLILIFSCLVGKLIVEGERFMPKTSEVLEHPEISLDLEEIDLDSVKGLEGSALEAIIKELQVPERPQEQAKHHSHHSYSTHGTVAW